MADQPTIQTLAAGARYNTSILNSNFTALRDAFDTLLGINGTGGANNTLTGDVDFAGNKALNITFDGTVVGLDWKGSWTTATAYEVNDLVFETDTSYICVEDHTSGVFATDLSASKWETFASGGASVTAFMATVLDDATAADARTTLVAQEDVITTRGDVIRGSSSGAAERLAVGTSGQLVGTDGTDIIWQDPSGLTSVQKFTANGTWTRPSGVTMVIVEVFGAGGGGGGCASNTAAQNSAGSGGG